ncbi:hypothetical protein [Pseudonocardia sp. ICBG1034]|uniref:hypothetical protein n=1 Tax=Pseudonocardia sp. ICBG1034 TaxID=2844381 RepID=UPI001CCBC07F|nr:hypothetical protein [Pseudonocardia sp. ICBG1034]
MTAVSSFGSGSEYLVLIINSRESAAAISIGGSAGAVIQRRQLEKIGLEVKGHWLVLGRYDIAMHVAGSEHAVLAFQLSAQTSGQRVDILPLLQTSASDGANALIDAAGVDVE